MLTLPPAITVSKVAFVNAKIEARSPKNKSVSSKKNLVDL